MARGEGRIMGETRNTIVTTTQATSITITVTALTDHFARDAMPGRTTGRVMTAMSMSFRERADAHTRR
jgi:hypothetical protein